MTVSNVRERARPMRALIATLVLGAFAPILDTTMLTIAVHTLVVDLHTDVATIQWVSTAYLLALVVTIPLCGWLDARLGGRRLWLAALIVFAAGSALCALSWSPASLIAFRTVQGAAAGVLMTNMQTIAVRAAGAGSIARVTAALGVPIALGPLIGPVLGGALLHWADWRWMFAINVPLCALAAAAAIRVLPDDAPARGSAAPPLDRTGLALLVPGIVLAFYGLAELAEDGGPVLVLLVAAGAALIAAFGVRALRIGDRALVRVRLLRIPTVAASTLAGLVAGGALMGTMFLLPLYWQTVRGDGALATALLLAPQAVGAFAPRFFVGGLVDRFGPRLVAGTAFALMAVATVPFAFVTAGTNAVVLALVLFVRGLGLGAVLVPIVSSAYTGLSRDQLPHASMFTRGAQQLGGAICVAVVALVLQAGLAHAPAEIALHPAFGVMAAVTALGALSALRLPGRTG
ncbi:MULTISPECIES: DHA2 family efflux MFS transporter permease subunit [Tsukamurella]|uniref:Multidrug efflux MFS transporter n=2 Tax=Tsukamurella TaxID=2060 RepID=A0A5C5S5T1_9ACTN|nr:MULTISPECIES: DHA2 family efflux MFS transporter permease subunit [Tsukamurella]NMD58576.1 multidrug efflux MFS transporter [Tsukamurella columbiensis]TWS30003.1 multidrug efflux MFS transporter [Tsukamurella conjunctivitidis]